MVRPKDNGASVQSVNQILTGLSRSRRHCKTIATPAITYATP